jgi:hypothetical protein
MKFVSQVSVIDVITIGTELLKMNHVDRQTYTALFNVMHFVFMALNEVSATDLMGVLSM